MLRLLAMIFAFLCGTVVLVIAITTWTFGEVTEVTSRHASYRNAPEVTDCVAHIRYEVDGKVYRSKDRTQVSGHHPTSECPFDIGQRAVVLYTSEHPEMGNSYTSGGDSWMFLLLFPLVPFAAYGNAQRMRRGLA